jgi:hypothetical protein
MLIRTTALFAIALAARADFSYTMTQKTSGGSMAAMAGTAADRTTKYYLKGQKMATSSTDGGTIIDFDAQKVTTFNSAQKSCSVKKFSDIAGADASNTEITVDVKETGQKKTINGFNAMETVIGMNMDMDAGRGPSMKVRIELDMWTSPDVPGASELKAFYQKNAANFPWKALAAGGNASIDRAMGQIQRKMAEMNGVVVEQIIRVSPPAGSQMAMPQMPQMSSAQAAQMQAAMAKMQEMAKQGGAQGAAAQQAMARMGGMAGGAAAGAPAGATGSLIEITVDGSGFSTTSVPDTAFAIPDGYKCIQ